MRKGLDRHEGRLDGHEHGDGTCRGEGVPLEPATWRGKQTFSVGRGGASAWRVSRSARGVLLEFPSNVPGLRLE